MRKTTAFAILLTWAGMAMGQAEPFPRAYPPALPGSAQHVYKTVDGIDLSLWLYAPRGSSATARPAVVFFFGGGWNRGTPAQFARQAQVLQSRGMAAILADYRVSSRHETRPKSAVEDAKAAIAWVRRRAPDFGIDPARIAAAGGSAGGHLAAATASLPGARRIRGVSSQPNALVLFNPAVVIAQVEGLYTPGERMRELFGRSPKSLSPYHHVRRKQPPTLILHGSADRIVPSDTALAYCDRVARRGGDCQAVLYAGADHGFFNTAPYFEPTLAQMLLFLDSLGWLDN